MRTLNLYRYRVTNPHGVLVGGGIVWATDWPAARRTAHGLLADPQHVVITPRSVVVPAEDDRERLDQHAVHHRV